MAEELIESVREMLKEEAWTRATINNYTENNLLHLNEILEKAQEEQCIDELKAVCDEKLSQTKESIIALYLSGMVSLKKNEIDNSCLVDLVQIFNNNRKESLVRHLCHTILDIDANNKFALRTLYGIYRNTKDEKRWEVAERLVKADMEEADIAKHLAEHSESESDFDNAVMYYKKALLRYINLHNMATLKEIWSKLVALVPEEIDFFLMVQRRIAKSMGAERSIVLLQELYQYYKDKPDYDIAISLLKLILDIDNKDSWARKEITDCFRAKYAGHSQLEEYINSSNLTSSFRNVFEAINDFEKHIAFDAKHFVFHRSWGVGKIKSVSGDNLVINFGKKNGIKEMSLKIAISALQPLSQEHIFVQKATKNKEELAKEVKDDPTKTLRSIIRSFGNSCSFKRIKAELVPSILSPTEWTNWNSRAKHILESDATFGVNPNNSDEFIVRDHKISKEEKLANEFKAQKKFFDRIDVLMRYANDEETDKENDLFVDMFSYFATYTKSLANVNVQVIASYLVVQDISREFTHLAIAQKYTFAQMFEEVKDANQLYLELKDTKHTHLRRDYLDAIKLLPNWADVYVSLFPTVCDKILLDRLLESGKEDKVKQLMINSFDDYKENRKAVLYFFRNCQDEKWFKDCAIPYEKQLVVLINIISHCYREMNNHVDTTENKKIVNEAEDLLFKNNTLLDYIIDKDTDTIKRIYTLVNDVKEISPDGKGNLRKRILEKDPNFKFQETEEKAVAPKGLQVTNEKLTEKKALLEQITNVDLPAVAKEIGEAMAKGDLKENAEYKAAKEHQAHLNTTVRKLQEELGRAVVFDPTTVTTAYVSFGTTTELLDKTSGNIVSYTILGPWESDPKNNIISYMSPFGNALLNAKEGQEVKFDINGYNYDFIVQKIKIAKL